MHIDPPELIVIMPVYNEQASIKKVVNEWFEEIENWTEDFFFYIINDGSTDRSLEILEKLKKKHGERLIIHNQSNRGHGQSCIKGYKYACEKNAEFVFQIDSDGQCNPQYFFKFWRLRHQYDVNYGWRTKRDDGIRRILASVVLKYFLLITNRCLLHDANVPYRLMKTSVLRQSIRHISDSFFLCNVGLAVCLKRQGHSINYINIRFRERYGGEPTVRISKFGEKAIELHKDLQELGFSLSAKQSRKIVRAIKNAPQHSGSKLRQKI